MTQTATPQRLTMFHALARSTGGVYAEDQAGMTTQEALRAAGLDFTVDFSTEPFSTTVIDDDGAETVTYDHLRPIVATWPKGPDGTRRPRKGLGAVRSRYALYQPHDLAEQGQAIIDEGGANVVAVGAYGDPHLSRMYMAFRFPTDIQIGGYNVDPHAQYLTLGASFDGTTGIWATVAPIRLACTNQVAGIMGNRFTVRHTGDPRERFTRAHEALNITNTWARDYQQMANQLLATPISRTQATAVLEKLLPTPAKAGPRGERGWQARRDQVWNLAVNADTCEFGRGTAYALYQATVEWADFFSPAHNDRTRQTRALDGGSAAEALKVRAARLLLAA